LFQCARLKIAVNRTSARDGDSHVYDPGCKSAKDFFRRRELAEAKRNRYANQEHVHQNPLDESTKPVRASCVQSAEWQDNQVHYQEQSNAVKHAANNEMGFKEIELPACHTIDRCGRIGDEEVQKYAEDPRADPPLKRLPSQQACGNGAWHAPAKGYKRRDQVEGSGDEAADENRNE
jgi:hypothetical protein